jgi:hypothetical protein
MSVNLYHRLRGILQSSPTLIAEVVAHNPDDTSTLRLPVGVTQETYASGVSVGSTFTARGTGVAVGAFAYVRDGIVQSQAPSGTVSDVVVGTVVAAPFGPPRLAAATAAVTLPAGTVGASYSTSLATVTTGGYAPRTYALASGGLPPGLTLSASGRVSGTPTAAGAYAFTLAITDSTRRSVTSPAVSLTVAA